MRSSEYITTASSKYGTAMRDARINVVTHYIPNALTGPGAATATDTFETARNVTDSLTYVTGEPWRWVIRFGLRGWRILRVIVFRCTAGVTATTCIGNLGNRNHHCHYNPDRHCNRENRNRHHNRTLVFDVTPCTYFPYGCFRKAVCPGLWGVHHGKALPSRKFSYFHQLRIKSVLSVILCTYLLDTHDLCWF